MSLFQLIATVASLALAASRLLKSLQPYWSKLPAPIAAAIPTVVMVLPAVADRLGGLHNVSDLKSLGLAALALLLPGLDGTKKDVPVPPVVTQ